MKILAILEWVAAVMIISAVVIGLGKVAVDQIVAMAAHPVNVPAAVTYLVSAAR